MNTVSLPTLALDEVNMSTRFIESYIEKRLGRQVMVELSHAKASDTLYASAMVEERAKSIQSSMSVSQELMALAFNKQDIILRMADRLARSLEVGVCEFLDHACVKDENGSFTCSCGQVEWNWFNCPVFFLEELASETDKQQNR